MITTFIHGVTSFKIDKVNRRTRSFGKEKYFAVELVLEASGKEVSICLFTENEEDLKNFSFDMPEIVDD